jgi:CRP-like cAMP-binding protein
MAVPALRNRLLAQLEEGALDALGPLESIELPLRFEVERPFEVIDFVYFPESCLVSIVADVPGDGSIEVGVIGYEGVSGVALIEGDRLSTFASFIQFEGRAYRLPAERFLDALERSDDLRSVCLRFARTFSIQLAATAYANGKAHLEARLARWLLMVADRTGETFKVTHEFLGVMLAVRRAGVTLALQILEGEGLIRSTRGTVQIIDRAGLIKHATGAYGLPEREYERLLGSPAERSLGSPSERLLGRTGG